MQLEHYWYEDEKISNAETPDLAINLPGIGKYLFLQAKPINPGYGAIDKAFEEIRTLLVQHQRQETGLLQSKNCLEEFGRTVPLDTPIDKDGQDTITLENIIPAGQDMDTAVDTYYTAVSRLPADMQPVFRRVIEKNETPKQAALNLGFTWTPTLERRLLRMKKKIYEEMV